MNRPLVSLLLAGLLTAALPALAADTTAADKAGAATQAGPIAIVNGAAISPLYVDVVRDDLMRGNQRISDDQIRNILINNELLYQEAVKQGLDKPASVQALIDLQRKDLLGKLLIQHYTKTHPVSEERIQAEYDKFKAKVGSTQYHVRHILVDNEQLADELIKKLDSKKPPKFEDLAKKYSKDQGSAAKGGDIGWMAPVDLVPAFADAMVKMKKGQVSQTPVKTQYGWHVIQLVDTRKLEIPSLDQVKDRIAEKLMQEDVKAYLVELRKNAKIEEPGAATN